MSEKKQSSVEWLESEMNRIMEKNNIEVEKIIWEQAKAMYEDEIKEAWYNSLIKEAWYNSLIKANYLSDDEYYKRTFKP